MCLSAVVSADADETPAADEQQASTGAWSALPSLLHRWGRSSATGALLPSMCNSTIASSCDALATAPLSAPGCERPQIERHTTGPDEGCRWHQRVPPPRRPQCV